MDFFIGIFVGISIGMVLSFFFEERDRKQLTRIINEAVDEAIQKLKKEGK